MTLTEVVGMTVQAKFLGGQVVLTVPVPWLGKPANFPRGRLQYLEGRNAVYSFDPGQMLAWLAGEGIIKLSFIEDASRSVH